MTIRHAIMNEQLETKMMIRAAVVVYIAILVNIGTSSN